MPVLSGPVSAAEGGPTGVYCMNRCVIHAPAIRVEWTIVSHLSDAFGGRSSRKGHPPAGRIF
jgi:hypothetical protein